MPLLWHFTCMTDGKITNIIFDFDGTIADSFWVLLETVGEILRHPQPLTEEQIEGLRDLSAQDVMKKLGIKKRQIPALAIRGRRIVAKKMSKVNAFDNMPELINELSSQRYHLFILSTNSERAITDFLKRNNLNSSIKKVYSGTSLFGKATRLKTLLKKEHLTAEQCVYIGDEIRDVEAARAVGIECISVGWGYNTANSLKSLNPEKFAANPHELSQAINSLS